MKDSCGLREPFGGRGEIRSWRTWMPVQNVTGRRRLKLQDHLANMLAHCALSYIPQRRLRYTSDSA